MPNNVDAERRFKTRVHFQTEIILKLGGAEVRVNGDSRDLSLGGIYIHTDKDIKPGTGCNIEVRLTGRTTPLHLKMKGTVIRKEPTGIAVSFESMGLESYTHLKNIVRYNASNPDEIF